MIKERILNELNRELLRQGRHSDEGAKIILTITADERTEFLNTDYFDNSYCWEIERTSDGNYILIVDNRA